MSHQLPQKVGIMSNDIVTAMERKTAVAYALSEYLDILNDEQVIPEGYSYSAVQSGSKYRIVMHSRGGGGDSVHAFVDANTGDLLKAASWKVPAKGVRYNLLTEMDVVRANFQVPGGWAGRYLYADHKRVV
jgi:hypothetical protein